MFWNLQFRYEFKNVNKWFCPLRAIPICHRGCGMPYQVLSRQGALMLFFLALVSGARWPLSISTLILIIQRFKGSML